MSLKRTFVLLGTITILMLACWAWLPRPYYRYGGGRVWLEGHPNACWNGLLRVPVFQFRVPPFTRSRHWRPTPEQVKAAALESCPDLSDQEILEIVRVCVPCE